MFRNCFGVGDPASSFQRSTPRAEHRGPGVSSFSFACRFGTQAELGQFRLCGTALKQLPAAASAPETDYAQKTETQTVPGDALGASPLRSRLCSYSNTLNYKKTIAFILFHAFRRHNSICPIFPSATICIQKT